MRARILMAALLLGGAVGLTRADEKPLDRAELDKRVVAVVYESAVQGTDIFNKGGYAECARLYQGTLMAVIPLLDHRPKLQADAKQRLERSKALTKAPDAAFELRTALDEIQNTIAPPVKKDTKDAKDPTKDTKDPTKDMKDPSKDTKDPKDTKETKDTKKVLWERLGGEAAVKLVVHDFVLAAAEDTKVNFTRDGKYKLDAKALEKSLVDMISESTGGPFKYTGKSMKEAHKGMAVSGAEFDLLAGHLVASLKKYKVSPAEIDELVKIVGGTRGDIVEGAKDK